MPGRTRKLGVAIVGCGTAGLACALVLDNLGHDITLYERFQTPEPVGSGLILQPTGLRILRELGLGPAIAAAGSRIDYMVGHTVPSLRRVLNVNYAALGGDQFGIAIHRGALFKILHDAVIARALTTNTNCDVDDLGDFGSYDLIVDASGANSKLRRFSRADTRIRSMEYGAIWGSFDWPGKPFETNRLAQRYVDAHTMVGVLPMGRGVGTGKEQVALFWSLRKSDYAAWRAAGLDAWKSNVQSVWPETSSILEQITSIDQMTMASYCHLTMTQPYGEKIAFIGDAAHATSPQLGQGANMALLDAWALGYALNRTADLRAALADYAISRRWHVRGFQLASLLLTPFYQSNNRMLSQVRDLSFNTISKMPGCRRLVAGLISGMLGDPLAKIGLVGR